MNAIQDVKTVRNILEEKQEEFSARLRDSQTERDEPFNPDRADLAQEYADRERRAALVERLEKVLGEIDAALQRLDDGTYGRCTECGNEIAPDRLEALPYAALCVACQEQEQNRSRYR